jgi:hypothetical protein
MTTRIAMMTAQAILDCGYGKMTQLINADITEERRLLRRSA